MNLSPAQARAAMLQVNPARLRAGRPIGLRDGALLALAAAGLSAAEISRLQASDLTMDRGRVVVTFQRRGAPLSITLPMDLGARVLTWLSELRLWAVPVPLFTGPNGQHSPRGISAVLDRYRSTKGRARRC